MTYILKIKQTKNNKDKNIKLPKKGTEHSIGYDVFCNSITKSEENKVTCNLGIALNPPNDVITMITPRSGLTKYNWVMNNSPGIGDPDYRGEYKVKFTAIPTGTKLILTSKFPFIKSVLTYDEFPYEVGDRIAQFVFIRKQSIGFDITKESLSTTDRGEGGFNSTGLK